MASERLRLLVTGARGKVGRTVADAAVAAGHRVVLTDVAAPAYGPGPGAALHPRRPDRLRLGGRRARPRPAAGGDAHRGHPGSRARPRARRLRD